MQKIHLLKHQKSPFFFFEEKHEWDQNCKKYKNRETKKFDFKIRDYLQTKKKGTILMILIT
jgi:hypothetical protein